MNQPEKIAHVEALIVEGKSIQIRIKEMELRKERIAWEIIYAGGLQKHVRDAVGDVLGQRIWNLK